MIIDKTLNPENRQNGSVSGSSKYQNWSALGPIKEKLTKWVRFTVIN